MARRAAIAVASAMACALAPATAAAAPVAGWWGGGPAGYDVQFLVVHSGKRALIQDVSVRCDALIWSPDSEWELLRAETRPAAAPVRRGGRIAKGRYIEFGHLRRRTLMIGRLGRRSGRIGPPAFGTGCETELDFDDRIAVRPLGRAPRPAISDGRWTLAGPASTRTGLEFVVTGGGAETSRMSGTLGGHLTPTPFGPMPCRHLGSVIEPAAVGPDGGFVALGGEQDPSQGTNRRLEGRFTDATTASGSYTLVNDEPRWSHCLNGTWPWTAQLVEPEVVPAGVLPAPYRQLSWVALGDSYSSGEGVKPFLPGTRGRANRCHRSSHAYSQVARLPGYDFFERAFFACSGAVTDNIGRFGASGALEGSVQYDEGSVQLGRRTPAEWQHADLVTITVGGNDAGFADVLTECLLRGCEKGRRARRITARIDAASPKLRSTYAAIGRLAPQATVVVLGYPNVFPARRDFRRSCDLKRTLPATRRLFLRRKGAQLIGVLRDEARAAGFHFVDVRRTFRGHEPCGRKKEWINAIVRRRADELDEGLSPVSMTSFHPNRRGQRGYADALVAYLRCTLTSPWPYVRDTGLPRNPEPGRRGPRRCSSPS